MVYKKKNHKMVHIVRFLEQQNFMKTHWTMRELAINVGYKSSTHFNNLIWSMVDDGLLRVQFSDHIKHSVVPKKAFVCLPDDYDEQLLFVEME